MRASCPISGTQVQSHKTNARSRVSRKTPWSLNASTWQKLEQIYGLNATQVDREGR